MSNAFETALKSILNEETAYTENGAAGYAHAQNPLLDINFAVSSLRGKSDAEIEKMFSAAFFFDKKLALKWLFFARDVRGGMGERHLFRVCVKWLASVHPEIAARLVPLFLEYGRFDDLLCLLDAEEVKKDAVRLIKETWAADTRLMAENRPISLMCKWLPSVNASSKATAKLGKALCKELGLSERQYHKAFSSMRRHLDVVERKMSAGEWGKIEYERVPSMANVKYRNAFLRNDEKRRREFLSRLKRREAKLNASASFPSDIVHSYYSGRKGSYAGLRMTYSFEEDAALEAMWKALPDYVVGNETGSTICVCDSSGSMSVLVGRSLMTAREVAYSVGIYFSERLSGPFKDKTITFSRSPKYVDLSGASSLAEKLTVMYGRSEVSDTNIEGVFDLLLETAVRNRLRQEDIPSNVMVISDMEFNEATGHRDEGESAYNASQAVLFKVIGRKWENAGYRMPRLVFWNINSRTNAVPFQTSPSGVALVSGYSPVVAKMAFSAKLDPYEALLEAIDTPRYRPVEDAVKDVI